MAGEIQDVMDKLVALQLAVPAPIGEKDIAEASDEPDAVVGGLPAFRNIEAETIEISRAAQLRTVTTYVDMALLFAPGEQKYSVRSRRKWELAVLNHFDQSLRLDNEQSPVQYSAIEAIDRRPVRVGETEYVASTFRLRVWSAEGVTPGA